MSSNKRPLFSVVIATRNREKMLARCLGALSRQSLRADQFEVWVVDNGSTDRTCALVHEWMKRMPNLGYLFLAERNVSMARNLGAQTARGSWLAFTDDDCLPPVNWLARAERVIRKVKGIKVLGGPIFDILFPGMKVSPGFRLAGWNESYGRKERYLKPNEYFIECNLIIERAEFKAVGRFNPGIGPGNRRFGFHEGTELQARIEGRNFARPVRYYVPNLKMRHVLRLARSSTWGRLCRSLISGYDHGRVFCKKPKHADYMLALRAHFAGFCSLFLAPFSYVPNLSRGIERYIFRCGEMWGEILGRKHIFVPHAHISKRSRGVLKSAADRLIPVLKWFIHIATHQDPPIPSNIVRVSSDQKILGLLLKEGLPSHACRYKLLDKTSWHTHPLLSDYSEYRSPKGFRLTLRNARVFGPTPAVVSQDGAVLEEVSRDWGKVGVEIGVLRNLRMPTKHKLEGRSFLAALLGGETYFHWMTDVMPILLQERGRNKNFDGYDYILTHQQLKSFHLEAFHKLGIPETKILALTKKTQYLCRELGFHSPHHDTGRPPAQSLRRVAQFFRPRMTTDEGRKIALLRPAGSSRQLLHRQQILELLLSLGFQEYEPSQDTIENQAKVFASAKVIVAAHGAALTNLIFARPGTTVVELFSARYVNPCYMHICAQLGLKHIPVVDESVPDGVVYDLMNAAVPILTTPEQVRSVL